MATKNFVPRADGEGEVGTSLKQWLWGRFKNLFVSGDIIDGQSGVSVTVQDLEDAVNGEQNAIHDNIDAEINAIVEKTVVHNDDLFLLEDSEDGFSKKKLTKQNVLAKAQIVTVAKSGGDFDTIQGAIDSITDASASKMYAVLVFPGDYAENITMKSYVDLVGMDSLICRITPSTGTAITFDAVFSNLYNIGIYQDLGTVTAATNLIVSAGGGFHMLRDCNITQTKADGNYVVHAILASAGFFHILNSNLNYNITGGTGTGLLQTAVLINGTASFIVRNVNVDIDNSDTNDLLGGFQIATGSSASVRILECLVNVSNAGSGITAGIYAYSNSQGFEVSNSEWTVTANGDAYGGYVDSIGNNAEIYTYNNRIIVTATGSGSNAYAGLIGAGDSWYSFHDKIVAATGITGAGTIKYAASSFFEGHAANSDYICQVHDATGGVDCNTASPGNAIPFDIQDVVDVMFSHSTTVNPSRIICNRTGLYKVSYNISYANTIITRTNIRTYCRVNGTTTVVPSASYGYARNTVDAEGTSRAEFYVSLTIGDYIEIMCEQAGSAGTVNSIANESWVTVEFLR